MMNKRIMIAWVLLVLGIGLLFVGAKSEKPVLSNLILENNLQRTILKVASQYDRIEETRFVSIDDPRTLCFSNNTINILYDIDKKTINNQRIRVEQDFCVNAGEMIHLRGLGDSVMITKVSN